MASSLAVAGQRPASFITYPCTPCELTSIARNKSDKLRHSLTVWRAPALSRPLSPSRNPIRRPRISPWTTEALQQSQFGDTNENDDSERQPSNEDKVNRSDVDNSASDLTMPNLKKLFTEAGDPNCEQCKGKGTIDCVVCNGSGFYSVTMMDLTSSTTCRMCRGRRSIPCPSCREFVFKSIMWWDQIPSEEEDPDENWRKGPDGTPRIPWGKPPIET